MELDEEEHAQMPRGTHFHAEGQMAAIVVGQREMHVSRAQNKRISNTDDSNTDDTCSVAPNNILFRAASTLVVDASLFFCLSLTQLGRN